MNIKSGKTQAPCARFLGQRFLGARNLARRFAAIAVLAGAAVLVGCHSSHKIHNTPPPWVAEPKGNDSVYVYVVGNALNRASAAAAREAAHQDALRQLAAQIAPDTKLPGLRSVEIMPGCVYYDEHDNRFDCWVQVSWPVAEKNKLIQQADRGPPPP